MMTRQTAMPRKRESKGRFIKFPARTAMGPARIAVRVKARGIFPLSHRAPHRGRKTTAPPQAHGEEAEVVDHSSRHQDGHHGGR